MPRRFAIRFSKTNRIFLGALGMGRKRAYVEVDADVVRVRMGWAFRADLARPAIGELRREGYVWWAFGVHGGFGRWIVNGSGHDIVSVRVDPPGRGRVIGFPVRVKELWVSFDDPTAFISALS